MCLIALRSYLNAAIATRNLNANRMPDSNDESRHWSSIRLERVTMATRSAGTPTRFCNDDVHVRTMHVKPVRLVLNCNMY